MSEQTTNTVHDIPYRANLPLQMLLQFDVYISALWALIYGFHILYNLSSLWNFHGCFVVFGFFTALLNDCWRLFAGYSGNLRARAGDLSLFLILSNLIQLPVLLFLLLSIKTHSILLTIVMGILFLLLFLEFLFGIYTWRQLFQHQNELFKLKREYSLKYK